MVHAIAATFRAAWSNQSTFEVCPVRVLAIFASITTNWVAVGASTRPAVVVSRNEKCPTTPSAWVWPSPWGSPWERGRNADASRASEYQPAFSAKENGSPPCPV
jgi:hypothetical protein